MNDIELGQVVVSDWSNAFLDCAFASCVVNFKMDFATDKEEISIITGVERMK
jgi:hypothetical protein